MEPRRVVITGIGAITPIGLGVEGLWRGLQRRESAVRCITRFDPSVFKSRIAGEVDDFWPADHMEERRSRRLDRFSQFSVAATRMALDDAALDPAREDPDRVGAMMGTALGGVAHGEEQYRNFMEGGPRAVDPALALTVFAGAASCNIAIEFGFTGPNSTNGMSCASGAIAIGEAFRAIVFSSFPTRCSMRDMLPCTGFSVAVMLATKSLSHSSCGLTVIRGLKVILLIFLVCEVVSSKVPVMLLEFPGDLFLLVLPEVLKNFTASTRPSPWCLRASSSLTYASWIAHP